MELLGQLEQYRPFNEQEERDRDILLRCLREEGDIFTRDNAMAHMTASAWVVNRERTKVLMAYHNIYHSWSWLGGHADGDEDVRRVIKKEIQEESGLTEVKFLSDELFFAGNPHRGWPRKKRRVCILTSASECDLPPGGGYRGAFGCKT